MYFLQRSKKKKMQEWAGTLHAEGVDPGSRCEGNTPLSIRGIIQKYNIYPVQFVSKIAQNMYC